MKKIFLLLLTITLMGNSIISSQAYSTIDDPYILYPHIQNIGTVEKGPVYIINGQKNQTYWQFSNIEKALCDLKNQQNFIISSLSSYYKLEELNSQNWIKYKEALDDAIYINKLYDENDNSILMILDCFDICENTILNNESKKIYNNGNFNENELALYLPYTEPLYKKYEQNSGISTFATNSFNISKAVTYAQKWARTYNYNFACFPGKDCTNFASQIARAGGIKDKSGWYYKSTQNYSKTWSVADQFVKYWKVSYSTTSFKNFSTKIKKGNFIAYDKNNDGKYDHVAFVTERSSKTVTTEKVTYTDFRIAQHSSNYLEWVSSSSCNWEKITGIKVIIKTPN